MTFPFLDALRAACKSRLQVRNVAVLRNQRRSLAVEELESRDLMSITSLLHSNVLGTSALYAPISSIYYFPKPTAAGNALINGLWDSNLRSAASVDYNRDGQITRTDMIDLLAKGTYEYQLLTSTSAHDLLTLVNNGATVAMPDYVQNLAGKVLNTSGANAYYATGLLNYSYYNPNAFVYQNIAAIGIGLQVNNWFLGTVRPDPNLYNANKVVTTAATYQLAANLPLFAAGGPVYQDVEQGQVGDCWLLAGLAEVADRTPAVIQQMFIDNGDGTYTVRFFNNGKADFVTVDKYLPNGGYTYDQPVKDLWVALAEKGYAQECGSGWIGTNTPGTSSYGALNFGDPVWSLSAITGKTANDFNITSYLTYPDLNVITNATNIYTAWSQGKYVVLGTSTPTSSQVVGNHVYALVGYSSGQYTLFNPWGTAGNYGTDGKFYPGFFKGDAKSIAANFSYWGQAGAAAASAEPQTMAVLGVFQTDVRPGVASAAETQPASPRNDLTLVGADMHAPTKVAESAALTSVSSQGKVVGTTLHDAVFMEPFTVDGVALR
jgi:Calpain family cysteine protease